MAKINRKWIERCVCNHGVDEAYMSLVIRGPEGYSGDDYDDLMTELELMMDDDSGYVPSASCGDYSPSCPWKAPGMSIHDFI